MGVIHFFGPLIQFDGANFVPTYGFCNDNIVRTMSQLDEETADERPERSGSREMLSL